ncbi:MAG: O-antigen ligase family protein [Clostridia bacterium]|nr:O-antigen ligase family protein [Clostridia bacterium]
MESVFKSEKAQNRIQNIRAFLLSDRWIAILFCLAGIITTTSSYFPEAKIEITGTIFFAYIIGITMVLSNDLMAGLIPFMFTYLIAIRCYDSFDDFMQYKWLVLPLIPMVLFNIIAYWKPLTTKGSQFKPMVFVSASILLGGIGFISPQEYFSGTSIYHMLGLGFGMVLIYSYFYAHISVRKDYSLLNMLTKIMVVTGCFAAFMVISHYLININDVLDRQGLLYIQWRNNLSTIIMITMPFAFLMANQKSYATVFGFIFYFALLLTGSRGGMVFGSVEIVMCIVMYMLYDRRRRLAYVFIIACLLFGFLAFSPQVTQFLGYTLDRLFTAVNEFLMGESTEVRAIHYARGINDFLTQPIFGTGLGYMGNRDVHASKEFALCWYHCEPIQIAASFGVVGIVAFVYQFIRRNMLIWKKATLFNMTIFLSYISLEMMSLVNPGILCPLPYLLLITLFMVVVEKCDDGEYQEKIYIRKKRELPKLSKIKEMKEKA